MGDQAGWLVYRERKAVEISAPSSRPQLSGTSSGVSGWRADQGAGWRGISAEDLPIPPLAGAGHRLRWVQRPDNGAALSQLAAARIA